MKRRGTSGWGATSLLALAVWLAPNEAAAAGLTITPDANPVLAGISVTLTIDPRVAAPGDHIDFDFGDGESGELAYTSNCGFFGGCSTVTHSWAGRGTFTVAGSGTLGGVEVTGNLVMTITTTEASRDLYIATGAHVDGFNQTVWRTDLEVHNPTSTRATYTVALLPRGGENLNPVQQSYSLLGGLSQQYADVVSQVFHRTGGAALRITQDSGSIMVTSRTYNQGAAGTYGQLVPAIPLAEVISYPREARLIGLHHNPSLLGGYRTNLGLVNASPAPISVRLAFHDGSGTLLGVYPTQLLIGEYKQLDRAFELVTQTVVSSGYVKLETTTHGGSFVAFASVIDNATGDPVFVTPQLVE